MGESVVQGYWAAYERGRMGIHEQTIKKFINTCHLWKEDVRSSRGSERLWDLRTHQNREGFC